MPVYNEYNLPIPEQLIDQIADRVAKKVMAKVRSHLVKSVPEHAPAVEIDPDRPLPTFLRLRDVVERLGVSRGSIYRWMSEGRFPRSVSQGGRSVDQDGEVVDVYLQAKRDGPAATRFFRRLLRSHGSEPRKIVTDKLRSYGVVHRELIPEVIHSTKQYENIRAD